MRFILILVSCLFAASCVTGEKAREVQPGMSQQEVVSVMGKPDGFSLKGEYTIYQYTNRLISGWSWDRADYSFIFKNNQLIEYGPGAVREKEVGGIQTIFLHSY